LLKEGFQPHKVKEVLLWGTDDPNYRSDITNTFDIKLAALRCHKSQVGDNLSPQMEEWLIQQAKEMAEGEDFEMAEAFHRVELWW
jgi:LmbE family N-acetylglucosaminyl deacetylase